MGLKRKFKLMLRFVLLEVRKWTYNDGLHSHQYHGNTVMYQCWKLGSYIHKTPIWVTRSQFVYLNRPSAWKRQELPQPVQAPFKIDWVQSATKTILNTTLTILTTIDHKDRLYWISPSLTRFLLSFSSFHFFSNYFIKYFFYQLHTLVIWIRD